MSGIARSGRGLLLSGGAARGAFQAGVVAALDRAGLRFDAIVGTSVGAVNGAALLHGYGAALTLVCVIPPVLVGVVCERFIIGRLLGGAIR